MPIQRILIVDDDSLSREFLAEATKTLGYQSDSVPGGDQALQRLTEREYDLVLTDLRMPGMDGVELVKRISKSGIPVVLITAHGTIEAAVEAMRMGASDFLVKPCTPDTIEMVIKRVERAQRLQRENEYLRSEVLNEVPEVVARSKAMTETLDAARRIAGSKGTVLITGESGTGKERVAQFIHSNSPRRDGPFIRVNCAALSETLLESELFGHERGAFTGAYKRREGRFELADGGTLLLDEIGEISPALQAKLLRVLEEEEFERVGGTATLKVDVRVVATTNRDLPAEVARGAFREDLYYRLHVLPIHVQPLRNRPEDIFPLADHFAARYASLNGRSKPEFSLAARERLMNWKWTGNVRELENAIQRAVILLEEDLVEPQHLVFGQDGQAKGPNGVVSESVVVQVSENSPLANRRLADIERVAILSTLQATQGNKTEAARRLGVTARTISNKMKLWRNLGLVA